VTIIFDENVPVPLRQFFAGHEVTTVQLEGWSGIQNGELISRNREPVRRIHPRGQELAIFGFALARIDPS